MRLPKLREGVCAERSAEDTPEAAHGRKTLRLLRERSFFYLFLFLWWEKPSEYLENFTLSQCWVLSRGPACPFD